jgi:hypothetical protein
MTVMKVRAAVTWLGTLGCLAAAGNLDFRFFVERVQPIFVKQRTGSGRCYDCHSLESNKALFHLAPFDRGEGWSDEASRRNFDNAAKLVTPGEPLKSRLLRHPLAQEAGGDPFHSGGKFWTSRDDPEFQTLADWVKGAIAK